MKDTRRPGEKIKISGVSELLGIVGEESAMEIEINLISGFFNHPFKVIDDERMKELTESIRENGVLTPVLIRPAAKGRYEMISGHRRMHAALLAGLKTIPAIIRDMTDDEAVINMVDANIQREELLPSERAWAFKMKMDAMRHQGTSRLEVGKSGVESAAIVGETYGIGGRQVQRYIRLTYLIPELIEMVDRKRLQFTVAVEISYIEQEIQKWLYEYRRENGFIKIEQITALRQHLGKETMTQSRMITIMNDVIRANKPKRKVIIENQKLDKYFPKSYTEHQIEQVIISLLEHWSKNREE
jgi:ParB family chromosome partitioning protein